MGKKLKPEKLDFKNPTHGSKWIQEKTEKSKGRC